MQVTLGSEARKLLRHPGPRLIAVAIVCALAVRLSLGRWTVTDVVVAAVIVVLQPFTEWLLHVRVLHAKPRQVFGRTFDSLAASTHRAHHADPRTMILIAFPAVAVLLIVSAGSVAVFAGRSPHAVTGLVVAWGMLMTYEWTHHLIHSSYVPRGRYYRSIWRSHRLHHYRNERYWFGVTANLADHLLRTFPGRDDVPLSPTARTLGIGPEPSLVDA